MARELKAINRVWGYEGNLAFDKKMRPVFMRAPAVDINKVLKLQQNEPVWNEMEKDASFRYLKAAEIKGSKRAVCKRYDPVPGDCDIFL